MSSCKSGRTAMRPMDPPARLQTEPAIPELLTLEDVCRILKLSRSTVERRIRSDPNFPQPRRLSGGRLIRFLSTEVEAYLAALPCAEYEDHAFDPNETRVCG